MSGGDDRVSESRSGLDLSAKTRIDDDAATRIEGSGGSGGREAAPPPAPPADSPPPLKIGRYTVLRPLGKGGMGVVYAAYDDELDRRVAIKVLLSRPEDGSLGRARLVREAQALAKLSHPNVVQVYEVGAVDQQVYLVMEYIEGLTLRQWLSDRRPPWREILRMYIETGQGLAAAHRAGLIHRDFKPANVIVGEDGRPRVLDFGLARAGGIPESSAALSRSSLHLSSSSRSLADDLTEAGTLLGTPAYMAPEQLFLTDTDARCDLYAFCVALWEALLGQRPYSARNVGELRKQVQAGPPTIPTSPVPSVILRLLHRGLAFERDDRWPSMEALLGALEGALVRRRRTFVAALALVVLVGLTVGAYLLARTQAASARACDAAADLRGLWDPAIRGEIEAAFAASGVAYADATWSTIAPRLDAHAGELALTQDHACHARISHEGEALPPVLAEQTLCLDRRRFEFAAVVGLLRRADRPAIDAAVAAVVGLEPIAACRDLEALARDAARRRGATISDARWAAIERQLSEARVAQRAEELPRARELADQALTAAEALDAAPLAAAARHRRGTIRELDGDFQGARDDLYRAFVEAEAVADDRLAAEVAIELLRVDGIDFVEAAGARTWEQVARAKLARAGDDHRQAVVLDLNRGIAALEVGQLAIAGAAIRAAVERAEAHRDADPRLYISALNILGSGAQKAEGDLPGAEATMRRALELHAALVGSGHPYNGMLIYNIGVIQFMRRDLDAALASFRRGLEIREAAYGPDHPEVAQSLNGLAAALGDLGREDEAIPLIERSLAIEEATRGPTHPELIYGLNNLAEVLIAAGRPAEAAPYLARGQAIIDERDLKATSQGVLILSSRAALARALGHAEEALALREEACAVAEGLYGGAHPVVGECLGNLAGLRLDQGDLAGAAAALERGRTILADEREHHHNLLALQMIEASLRWAEPGRRAEARALVDAVAAEVEKAAATEGDKPEFRALRRQIKAWRADHPA